MKKKTKEFSDPRDSCKKCIHNCSDRCDDCDWSTNPYSLYEGEE